MEEQSLEETRPDLKSEDLNAEKAADVVCSDDLAKPDGESGAVEVEETEQATVEKDESGNMQNAPGTPEEQFEASVGGDESRNMQNAPGTPEEHFEASVGGDESRNTQNAPGTPEEEFEASVGGDESRNMQNAPGTPEEQFEASVRGEELKNTPTVPGTPEEDFEALVKGDGEVGEEFKNWANSDVEIFQNKDDEEEPGNHEDEDHTHSTDLQHYLQLGSEEEQELLLELQAENEKLRLLNDQLQAKLAQYFWLRPDIDVQSVQKQLYPNQDLSQKYPDILEDIMRQRQEKKQDHLQHHKVNELLRQNNEKLEQIKLEWSTLMSSKCEVLLTDLARGNSKMEAVAERLLRAAQKCEDEFVSVRHENFKLNLKLSSMINIHDLDEDVHSMDFEQLNFEKHACSEKMQECEEELQKLKRTLPQTGHILLHVKEKLRFLQVDNQEKQAQCKELDVLVPREQETLTQTMQARDRLRFDNLQKRKDCGLLGNTRLLRNLEDMEDECEALERQVKTLERS